MRRTGEVLLASVLLVGVAAQGTARLRWHYDDDKVVTRSELIVVGHIRDGSVRYVPHKVPPGHGMSWEHHAVLVVTEVLKGRTPGREIPIVLHYGLDPNVGGRMMYDSHARAVDPPPTGVIRIVDTANAGVSLTGEIKDAREDHLWFLRKGIGMPRQHGADMTHLGIVDPEDLRPLALKKYLTAYLSQDPERAVRDYLAGHPEIRERAERYLDRREIERIVKLPDAKLRTRKLIPYFFKKDTALWWRTQDEARKGLAACGDAAGAAMMELFEKVDEGKRQWIIRLWGEVRYRPAVDRLLTLLREGEKFWDACDVKQGWWNDDRRPLRRESQRWWSEMHYAVESLRKIDDPRTDEIEKRVAERLKRLGKLMPRDPNAKDNPPHIP